MTDEGLLHDHHLDTGHEWHPLLLIHLVHLGGSTPVGEFVGRNDEDGLGPPLHTFFRDLLVQVGLHSCSISFEELKDIWKLGTFQCVFHVELRYEDDLSLTLFIRLGLDHQSTLGERGPLTDKDFVESFHDLGLAGGGLAMQPQAPLLRVWSLDEYLAKTLKYIPVTSLSDQVDSILTGWDGVVLEVVLK